MKRHTRYLSFLASVCCLWVTSTTGLSALPVEKVMRALQERREAVNQNHINGGRPDLDKGLIDWNNPGLQLIGFSGSVPPYPEDGFFDPLYEDDLNYEENLRRIVSRLREETIRMSRSFAKVENPDWPFRLGTDSWKKWEYPQLYLFEDFDERIPLPGTADYAEVFEEVVDSLCQLNHIYLSCSGQRHYHFDYYVINPPEYSYVLQSSYSNVESIQSEGKFSHSFGCDSMGDIAGVGYYTGRVSPVMDGLDGQVVRLIRLDSNIDNGFEKMNPILTGIDEAHQLVETGATVDMYSGETGLDVSIYLPPFLEIVFPEIVFPDMHSSYQCAYGFSIRYLIKLEFREDLCDPCPRCDDCGFGSITLNEERVDVSINLDFGEDFGSLHLNGVNPSPDLVSRDMLRMSGSGFDRVLENDVLTGFEGAEGFVSIADINYSGATGYELEMAIGTTGVFKRVKIYSPNPLATDGFELVIEDGVKLYRYVYDEAGRSWSLHEGAGSEQRVTRTLRGNLPDGDGKLMGNFREKTVLNHAEETASAIRSEYTHYPFGSKLTREVRAAGESYGEETLYSYYTDEENDGDNHSHLESVIHSGGSWMKYLEYDSRGRVLKEVRQLGNNTPDDAWPGVNRAYETVYDGNLTTHKEYEGGQLVRLEWTEQPSPDLTRHIVATTVGATGPEDASNLVTTTRTYLAGPGRQKTRYVIYPDGTAQLNFYSEDAVAGTKTHESLRGVPDSTTEPTAILSGTKTVTVTDANDRVISRTVTDIETAIEIELTVHTNPDVLGRHQDTHHLGGLTSTRQYACCGLSSETGHDGITRDYYYDSLGRLNRTEHYFASSLTGGSRQVHDALGRVVEEIRIGGDQSERTLWQRGYDLLGRVTFSEDALGRVTTYNYSQDTSGFLVETETLPGGGEVISRYYQDGRLYERVGSAVAAAVRYEYGTTLAGETTRKETLLSRNGGQYQPTDEYTLTVYGPGGALLRTERPHPQGSAAAVTTYAYNSPGQLESVTDADGVVTLYEYNALGRQSGVRVDPDGLDIITTTVATWEDDPVAGDARVTVTLRGTDPSDALTGVSSADGLIRLTRQYGRETVTVTEWNGTGYSRRETTTFADGTSEVLTYNGAGLLESRVLRGSGDTPLETITYAYTVFGEPASQTHSRSGTTTYEYYPDGSLKKLTTPAPNSGGPDNQPLVTQWSYFNDPVNGRKTVTTLPDSSTRTEEYHPSGLPHRRHGAGEYPVEYHYDAAGRMSVMRTWQDFSSWGSGYAETTWQYNAAGLPSAKKYPDNTGPVYTHTAAGRLATRTWERGVAATYAYNDAGLPQGITYSDATPGVSYTAYDRAGRVTSITDATGPRYLGYASGILAGEHYGSGLFPNWEVSRQSDPLGRLGEVAIRENSRNRARALYHYSQSDGRLQAVEGFGLEAVYDYLPQGRQVETVSIHRGESTPLATTLTWDNLNRLKASLGEPSASTPQSHTYHYDKRSRRIQRQQSGGEHWSFGYDTLNQLASAVKRGDNDNILPGYDWNFAYDSIGNRTHVEDSGRGSDYTVNALNQITSRDIPRLMRFRGLAHPDAVLVLTEDDPVTGTVTSVTRQSGSPYWLAEADYGSVSGSSDRRYAGFTLEGILAGAGHNNSDAIAGDYVSGLLGPDPETFTHDADGNLTQDAFWNYTWDAENRLITIEHRSDLQSFFDTNDLVRKRFEFVYDNQSRRVQKDVFVWDGAISGWTLVESLRWLYDHWNPMVERVSTNGTDYTLARTYLWGLDLAELNGGSARHGSPAATAGGVGGLLAIRIAGSNEVLLPTHDGHGNVMTLVHADNGTVVAEYEYGPFGEPLRVSGAKAGELVFRFSTKYTDHETGLLYYGLRYYDPETGRWLNRDPIGEQGGLNLYGFIGNDPVNAWDYLGLAREYIGFTGPQKKAAEAWEKEGKRIASDLFAALRAHYSPSSLFNGVLGGKLTTNERNKVVPDYISFHNYQRFRLSQINQTFDRNDYRMITCSWNPKHSLRLAVHCRGGTKAFVIKNDWNTIYICPDFLDQLVSEGASRHVGVILNEISHVAFQAYDDDGYHQLEPDEWPDVSDWYEWIGDQKNPTNVVNQVLMSIYSKHEISLSKIFP